MRSMFDTPEDGSGPCRRLRDDFRFLTLFLTNLRHKRPRHHDQHDCDRHFEHYGDGLSGFEQLPE